MSEWSYGDRARELWFTNGNSEHDHISTCLHSAAVSHDNNTISSCHYQTSKLNHQVNILFLFSPSWCLSPSVLVWHILPHCPLEHFKSSYLLLQIWPMFFPSSFSSFVIHLLLRNPTFPRWSHSEHPSLILASLVPKKVLGSLNSPFWADHTVTVIILQPLSQVYLGQPPGSLSLTQVFLTLAHASFSEAFSTQERAQRGYLRQNELWN